MNLRSLRRLLALGLIAVAGHSWATPSLPQNDNPTWQDISSIAWSTNNGASWGNSAVAVGQSVEFKITMHKTNIGNHYADFVKAWVDLNGDGQFSNSNETLLFGYKVANAAQTAPWNAERSANNQLIDFTSNAITLTSALPSDLWMLARVTCSDSLMSTALGSSYSWNQQWATSIPTYNSYFSPTAHYGQGESELVKLSVNKVPEPGTLALFAIALVGLNLRGRRATGT
jgi:hypothetical protein